MNSKNFNYYVEGRGFEWAMALSMFVAGANLIVWPETLAFGGFQWLLEVMTQKQIAIFMLIIGWFRVCSLMVNGQTIGGKKIGPYVRSVGSVFSATLWVQFVLALLQQSFEQGFPSLALPFWAMFTVTELYVAYTTVKNA